MSAYSAYTDAAWFRKYLSGEQASHIPMPGELPARKYIQIPWAEEETTSCVVRKYDIHGTFVGDYEVLIQEGAIYHVSKNKALVQTGAPGFGIVTLQYNEEKQAYTEQHGWIKKHSGGTIQGYYNNCPFTLLLNHGDKCVEIFSHVSPSPWIGTIRRRFDEWGSPVEIAFRDNSSAMSTYPLEILVSSSAYLRDFFE